MKYFCETLNNKYFNELVRRNSKKMYLFALSILRDRDDAKDAVQNCFIKIIDKRSSYDFKFNFSSWLFKILKNLCIDLYRKNKKVSNFSENLPEPKSKDYVDKLAEANQAYFAIDKEFNNLSQNEHKILTLRIKKNFSFKEIAIKLNISEDAAKKRAYRALNNLQNLLGKDFKKNYLE